MNNAELNPIEQLLSYYRNIYSNKEPVEEIIRIEGDIPEGIKENIQLNYAAEPFYGYFDEDMTKDALLLMINPGEVDENRGFCSAYEFNEFHKERYLNWTKKEYFEENERLKTIHPSGNRWRESKKREINRIINFNESSEEVQFLHTIEFFPFHSKKFNFGSPNNMEWMCKSKSSNLIIEAIKYMAEQHKVKYIFGIGLPWVTIFEKYGFKPCDKREYKNESTGRYRFRLYKYKFSENAVPIIISISGAGKISLPSNPQIVDEIRKMLD